MPASSLRVAVIGSGPSGFYVVQSLLRVADLDVRVDLFDALPTPYGLVRYGVAPDHPKTKNVAKAYAKTAADPRVRFFGNVTFGRDVTIEDLRGHYHQIVYCTGTESDRRLGIPGEDLDGSYPATSFVAWYNGHPDFCDLEFPLDCERAVVIGVGNVALDVARILVRTPDELARTDMADYAIEALRESRIREVVVLGRRGPTQAAFTNSEIEELGRLETADTVALPREVRLDDMSRADLAAKPDRQLQAKVDLLEAFARKPKDPKPRRIVLRFLAGAVELREDGQGRVHRLTVVGNKLRRAEDGSLRPRPTNRFETIEAGLVFRSVGYIGERMPGVPFREDWGTIPHEGGRVLEAPGASVVTGEYCAGWIKRGPSGIIGTNRPDAQETVDAMVADFRDGRALQPDRTDDESVPELLDAKSIRWVSFAEWTEIDEKEVARGAEAGRPRVKFTSREAMLAAIESS